MAVGDGASSQAQAARIDAATSSIAIMIDRFIAGIFTIASIRGIALMYEYSDIIIHGRRSKETPTGATPTNNPAPNAIDAIVDAA